MKMRNVKLYPLSDGRHIVSYLDPVKRKRVQRSFTDESSAKSFVLELTAPAKRSGEFNFLKTASTETALRTYLEQVPNSYLSQSGRLIREFLDFFAVHGVPRLTECDLQAFFTYLKNEYDYSERSLLSAKSRLQGFFKFLIEHQAIAASPLDQIKFNRGAPFKRKPILFTEEEIRAFIEKARTLSPAFFYPIFLLIHETAAKASDILRFQWKDVHFKTNTVELIRSPDLQARSFTVSDDLLLALRMIERCGDTVFTTLDGRPQQRHILGRELKRFQRQAGYSTKWCLKDLRASHGVNFLKRGGTTRELQKIMGHVRPYQTEEIFGRYSAQFFGSAAVQESRLVT